jgi:glycosyltransferase involved in cell wall biosynthesis
MGDAREAAAPTGALAPSATPRPLFFHVHPEWHETYLAAVTRDSNARATQAEMESFCGSAEMNALIADAAQIEPEVGSLNGYEPGFLPPWHDGEYAHFRKAVASIPAGPYDSVVLVPFGKLGGADLVAGILAGALVRQGRTLILRTDLSDWDRPDWYPDTAPAIDISAEFSKLSDRPRALYMLLRELGARRVWNVNSRLGFDMLVHYGARLAVQSQLYAYYFCADRDSAGNEVGYPVWYFANILPHLTAAIFDTADLARSLTGRYSLPDDLAARVRTVYTPALTPVADGTLAKVQADRRAGRLRPRVLWGGRLDRQKRFDIVIDLARAMPDVDFDAWGKAVLDTPPDLSGLPPNLRLNPPFSEYAQLPMKDADGWLYTSDWDGLPTILIELGAMGMPIVASAVGGVPELIDSRTGWPVDPEAGLAGYEAALRSMLADPGARQERAAALQRRIAANHDGTTYDRAVAEIGS